SSRSSPARRCRRRRSRSCATRCLVSKNWRMPPRLQRSWCARDERSDSFAASGRCGDSVTSADPVPGLHEAIVKAVVGPAFAFLLAAAGSAAAQGYPAKPIRIVVPFPPVGAADLLTRTVGQKLTESWGQQIIVDNRPGAGGNLGVELVAKSPPDGSTAVMSA